MMIKKLIVLAAFLTAKGQEIPSNPNNLLLRGSTGEVFTETDKQDDFGFDFENERLEQLTCKKELGEKCKEPYPSCCDGTCEGPYGDKTCQCVGTKLFGETCEKNGDCCSNNCDRYLKCYVSIFTAQTSASSDQGND